MSNTQRFIFLSEKFFKEYPTEKFPQIKQKDNRPYIQIIFEIDGIRFAAPLCSGIHHPHAFWTNKKEHKGIDLSKAIVIKDDSYINTSTVPYLRPEEFVVLKGKDFQIKAKMKKYLQTYKDAKSHPDKPFSQKVINFSALQYFEKEIGL